MWRVWTAKLVTAIEIGSEKGRRLVSWTRLLWPGTPFCFGIGCPCWHLRVYALILLRLFPSPTTARTFQTLSFSQEPWFRPIDVVLAAQVRAIPSRFSISAKLIALSSPFLWLAFELSGPRRSWIVKRVLVLFGQARLNLSEVQTLWRIFALFRDFLFKPVSNLFSLFCLFFLELNNPLGSLNRVMIELHIPLLIEVHQLILEIFLNLPILFLLPALNLHNLLAFQLLL